MARFTMKIEVTLSDGCNSRATTKAKAEIAKGFLDMLRMYEQQGIPIATDEQGLDIYIRDTRTAS